MKITVIKNLRVARGRTKNIQKLLGRTNAQVYTLLHTIPHSHTQYDNTIIIVRVFMRTIVTSYRHYEYYTVLNL